MTDKISHQVRKSRLIEAAGPGVTMSSVRCNNKRADPAMLTTRPSGRNETFSPTAANYGFGDATCGRGSCVVTTLGTLLPDRRFTQGKICKGLHTSVDLSFKTFHPGFLHCRRLGQRTSLALGQRVGTLDPSGDMIDMCPDIDLSDRHVLGHPSQ